MRPSNRLGVLTCRLRWAIRCPSYALCLAFTYAGSPLERRFHLKRRLASIAALTGSTTIQVEDVLSEAQQSDTLNNIETLVSRLGWLGTFRAARELYAVVRLTKPECVVETGVGAGYSSVYILEALRQNRRGNLRSVDLPNADPGWKLPFDVEPGFLVPGSLRGQWELVLGESKEALPVVLAASEQIDIFLHDSLHTYGTMSFEFTAAWPRLREGGLLISDDALWNTALLDFAKVVKEDVRLIYHQGGSAPVAVLRKGEARGSESLATITHQPISSR